MGDQVSSQSISDLVTGKRRADPYVGAARAALGQGLGMGWGDEAEAWLRERLGQGSYEDQLKQIRGEYSEYSQEHPVLSGGLEFAGGAAPGVAAMMIPGGQVAGAQQLARTGAGALGRLAGIGAATGAVSGAGTAQEGDRVSGGLGGAAIGGVAGAILPMAMKGTSAAGKWLMEKAYPTEQRVARAAAEKMTKAIGEGGMTPQQIEQKMVQDRAMGVPSVVANVSPATVDLAEAVAQRTGKGARNVGDVLTAQKQGARERAYTQVNKNMQPGDYYSDLKTLQEEMKQRAGPLYTQAYAYGEVKDPNVLKFMQLPQFQQGLGEAQKLLAAEGRTLDMTKPTVEVLDQVKRGLDTLIEKETDAVTGKTTALGRVYTAKKNEFLKALDAAVPDYELARGVYSGGAEMADAMRKGMNEFGKLDHEQVIQLVSKMSKAEKEAFRTGVARDLYSRVMDPSGNFNAAQRIIGAPEMQAKLQPLFDSPNQFNLFKTALERESQLFNQANQVLGGSQTGKRLQMRESLDAQPGVGEAVRDAVTGGFWNSLTGIATRAIRNTEMPEKTAEKLSQMLMAKDPHEVAAVVKLLEDHAAAAVPKAYRAGAAETGAVTGATSAFWPTPAGEAPSADIEAPETTPAIQGPDIEADIAAEAKSPR